MNLTVNYLAVLAAAVAGVVINTLWYSVILKGPVAALRGGDPTIAGRQPAPPMYGVAIAGQLVLAFVLAIVMRSTGIGGVAGGVLLGALLWLGFTLPALAQVHTFGYRRLGFIPVDAGNWLLAAVVMGAILGAFG